MRFLVYICTLPLLLYFSHPGHAQQITRRPTEPHLADPRADPSEAKRRSMTVAEQKLKYAKEVLRQEFDFQLSPVAEGKFSLDIVTGNKGPMLIKVYDIIGNLLYEKNVRVRGTLQEEVDLSHLDVHFFVVEVGNEETNRTKSIVTL